MESGRVLFDPTCHGNMLFLGNGDFYFRGARTVMNMEEASRKRPFFSSPEELYDEEFYDEQLPEKKRRLTPEQVHLLEKSFEAENKLEPERKTELAKKLGLQPRQVAVWFQNRRVRWKTKQLERDYDQLKSSYDSLFSNCDSIRSENEKLKAEILSLTEKLQAKETKTEPSSTKNSDPILVDVTPDSTLHFTLKVEDHLSTGSGGSAVVDEDGPQLVDSGDSYNFPTDDGYPGCVTPVDRGVQSEEDDATDDGQNYMSNVVVGTEHQQQHEEGEPLGWWVWS